MIQTACIGSYASLLGADLFAESLPHNFSFLMTIFTPVAFGSTALYIINSSQTFYPSVKMDGTPNLPNPENNKRRFIAASLFGAFMGVAGTLVAVQHEAGHQAETRDSGTHQQLQLATR